MTKTTFPQFEQAKKDFLKEVNNIYKKAINVDKNGADIYTTFCTNLAQDLDDTKRKNKIFIITDGYLLFEKEYLGKRPKCSYMRKLEEMRAKKDKWKSYFEKEKLGLCPCENQRPKNASAMMFEVANKYRGENPYEFYMVEHYWKNWFAQMKVPVIALSYGSKSATINSKIAAFIAGE